MIIDCVMIVFLCKMVLLSTLNMDLEHVIDFPSDGFGEVGPSQVDLVGVQNGVEKVPARFSLRPADVGHEDEPQHGEGQ